jgi:hypothetical protein
VFTCCWSVKGGSGVSVVAAALALIASRDAPTALVDLCGDLPAVLGIPEPADPAPPVTITATLTLVPHGSDAAADAATVVVDAGCVDHVDSRRGMVAATAERSLLVVRPCYLALRRATRLGLRPHGIVVVAEPGRALRGDDIAAVVGAPVVAEVPFAAAISRAVDAGLLLARCPVALASALEVAR